MLNPHCVIELMAHPHMSMFFNTILIVYINVYMNVYILVVFFKYFPIRIVSYFMLFDVEQSYLLFQHPPFLSDFPHDIPIGCVPAAAVISAKLRRSW